MAYGSKYHVIQKTKIKGTTTTYRIELLEDGFGGSSTRKNGNGGTGVFRFGYDGADVKKIWDNPVQKGYLELDILIESSSDLSILTDIISGDEDDYQLRLKKGGSVVWTGFVIPDLITYTEGPYPFSATITAKDLHLLESDDYATNTAISYELYATAIADLLNSTGLSLGMHIYDEITASNLTATDDFFEQAYFDEFQLQDFSSYSEGEFEPISKLDALRHLLPPGFVVRQYNDKWKLFDLAHLAQNPTAATRYEYNASGSRTGKTSSVDLTVGVDRVDSFMLGSSVNKPYPALKRLELAFNHKTSIQHLLFDNQYLHTDINDRSSEEIKVSDTTSRRFMLSGQVEVTTDTNPSSFRTGNAKIIVQVGGYEQDVSDGSWGLNTGEQDISVSGSDDTLTGTFTFPADSDVPSAVGEDTLTVELRWATVSGETVTQVKWHNLSAELVNGDSVDDGATKNYRLVQTGNYSLNGKMGTTVIGQGPDSESNSAIRYLDLGTHKLLTGFKHVGGSGTQYEEFVMTNIMNLQRQITYNIDADLWAFFDADNLLSYRSKTYFMLNGELTGKNSRWRGEFVQLSWNTGSDTFTEYQKISQADAGATIPPPSGQPSQPSGGLDEGYLRRDGTNTMDEDIEFDVANPRLFYAPQAGEEYSVYLNRDVTGFTGNDSPWNEGVTIESDQGIFFIESDQDQVIGWMDVNQAGAKFKWHGEIVSESLTTEEITFETVNPFMQYNPSAGQEWSIYLNRDVSGFTGGGDAPSNDGMTLESDNNIFFIESDSDKILGWMDMNAEDLRWKGDVNSNTYSISGTEVIGASRDLKNISTINTGQGANELYAMDQNVRTSDIVQFNRTDTGWYIFDTRDFDDNTGGDSGYMPPPSSVLFSKSAYPIFSMGWAGNSWGSIITFGGWNTSYAKWQIAGPSSNSINSDEWYLRTGIDSTWNTWHRIARDNMPEKFTFGGELEAQNSVNISAGNLQIGGTEVFDSGRNLSASRGEFADDVEFFEDIVPDTTFTGNVGRQDRYWLTGRIAELYVPTLVVEEHITTTNGVIFTGLGNILASDIAAGATSIDVQYNNLSNGQYIVLYARSQYEKMKVTSAASGTGPYTYSVTRDVDGSGANAWVSGDGIFNTGGAAGFGYIEQYAQNSISTGVLTGGPTTLYQVRTGTSANDIAPRAAVGDLDNYYGYSATEFGFAAGDPAADYVTIDATNGIRFIDGADSDKVLGQFSSQVLTFGDVTETNDFIKLDNSGGSIAGTVKFTSFDLNVGSGALVLDSTNEEISFNSGEVTIGSAGFTIDAAPAAGWNEINWLHSGTSETHFEVFSTDSTTSFDDGGVIGFKDTLYIRSNTGSGRAIEVRGINSTESTGNVGAPGVYFYYDLEATQVYLTSLTAKGTAITITASDPISYNDGSNFYDVITTKTSDLFDNAGTYAGLRAQSTTKGDVGLGNVSNVDTTNASNITSGNLPSAQLPTIMGNLTLQDTAAREVDLILYESSSLSSGANNMIGGLDNPSCAITFFIHFSVRNSNGGLRDTALYHVSVAIDSNGGVANSAVHLINRETNFTAGDETTIDVFDGGTSIDLRIVNNEGSANLSASVYIQKIRTQ